jgi:hypothetical protein
MGELGSKEEALQRRAEEMEARRGERWAMQDWQRSQRASGIVGDATEDEMGIIRGAGSVAGRAEVVGNNYLERMAGRNLGRAIGSDIGGDAGGVLGMIGGTGAGELAGWPVLAALIAAEAGISAYSGYEANVSSLEKASGQSIGSFARSGTVFAGMPAPGYVAGLAESAHHGFGRFLSSAITGPGTALQAEQTEVINSLAAAGLPADELMRDTTNLTYLAGRARMDAKPGAEAISRYTESLRPEFRQQGYRDMEEFYEASYKANDARRYNPTERAGFRGEAEQALGRSQADETSSLRAEVGLRDDLLRIQSGEREGREQSRQVRESETRVIDEQIRTEHILSEARERGAGSTQQRLDSELGYIQKVGQAEKDKLNVTVRGYVDEYNLANQKLGQLQELQATEDKSYETGRTKGMQPYGLTPEGRKLAEDVTEAQLAADASLRNLKQAYTDAGTSSQSIDAGTSAMGDLQRQNKIEEERRIAQQVFSFDTSLSREQLETQIAGTERFGMTPSQRLQARMTGQRQEAALARDQAKQAGRNVGDTTTPEDYRFWLEKAQALASLSTRDLSELPGESDQEAFLAGRPYSEISSEHFRQQAIQQQIAVGRYREQAGSSGIPTRRMGDTVHSSDYRGMGEHPSGGGYHAMGAGNQFETVITSTISGLHEFNKVVRQATDAHNQPDSGPVATLPW